MNINVPRLRYRLGQIIAMIGMIMWVYGACIDMIFNGRELLGIALLICGFIIMRGSAL